MDSKQHKKNNGDYSKKKEYNLSLAKENRG